MPVHLFVWVLGASELQACWYWVFVLAQDHPDRMRFGPILLYQCIIALYHTRYA